MTVCSDYAQLTKFDKTRSKSLKKAIAEVCRKLGSGVMSPVPYDTAWVARIPKLKESSPAFPASFQWLRDNQSEDGSWGTEYPFSLHSKMLNTFVAVLAFSEWNYEQDKNRIKRGIKAVELIANTLTQEETDENTFEMIVSGLLDDARNFKLDLAFEKFEWYSKIGKEKLKKIDREIMSNRPNKYWSFLEAANSMDLQLSFYRPEIIRHGLIAAQPSTTAFILRYARLRRQDFPEAESVFENICSQNQGGVPHLLSIDNFEIIYGLEFLLKVDINQRLNCKFATTQKIAGMLVGRMGSKNQLGFSSNWPIVDEECTSTALRVTQQISGRNSDLTESNRRQNLPCQVTHFDNITRMKGIRNVSSYYSWLQEVSTVPKDAVDKLAKFEINIGRSQNRDGGWGDEALSSVEETAYVCLAIFCLIQTRKEVLDLINFPKLVNFMNRFEILPKNETFWRYKVICGSTVLTETIITAAKYALFQIQRLCMFSEVLNDNRMDFVDVRYQNKEDQLIHRGMTLTTSPKIRGYDIEFSKVEIENICKSILQIEESDSHMRKQINVAIEASYLNDFKMLPYDRAGFVIFVLFINLTDAYVDCYSHAPEAEIEMFIKTVSKILKGDCQSSDLPPSLNLPRIEIVWRCCFHCRKTVSENNSNTESLVKILEEWLFKAIRRWCQLQRYDIKPTLKEYLEISKRDCALIEFAHYTSLTRNEPIDLTEFQNDELFVKYCDCAAKAFRLLGDVPSVFKDMKLSRTDNYCILLMHEFGISLDEAMMRTTKKGNKEIMKMYSLKKVILGREKKINEKLVFAMRVIEFGVNRGLEWAFHTERYQVEQKCLTKRVHHETKGVSFVWDLCFNQNYITE